MEIFPNIPNVFGYLYASVIISVVLWLTLFGIERIVTLLQEKITWLSFDSAPKKKTTQKKSWQVISLLKKKVQTFSNICVCARHNY
jgi:hypothetical protein